MKNFIMRLLSVILQYILVSLFFFLIFSVLVSRKFPPDFKRVSESLANLSKLYRSYDHLSMQAEPEVVAQELRENTLKQNRLAEALPGGEPGATDLTEPQTKPPAAMKKPEMNLSSEYVIKGDVLSLKSQVRILLDHQQSMEVRIQNLESRLSHERSVNKTESATSRN